MDTENTGVNPEGDASMALASGCEDRRLVEVRELPREHACMHACIHTCIRTYIPTHIHACIRAYMHTCIHACMHTCIHTHTHTHTHTYTHTSIQVSAIPPKTLFIHTPAHRKGTAANEASALALLCIEIHVTLGGTVTAT